MIEIDLLDAEKIIKALDEGSAKDRRYAANIIDRKIAEYNQKKMIETHNKQVDIIKKNAIEEHLQTIK